MNEILTIHIFVWKIKKLPFSSGRKARLDIKKVPQIK